METGLLKVGIREDAVPFGYRDINGDLEGLCLDFIAVLRDKLKQELIKTINFYGFEQNTSKNAQSFLL